MAGEMPILASNLQIPRIIKAYCNKCKTVTDHIIYPDDKRIRIKCITCEKKDVYAGIAVLAFESLYCKECKRETLWALYCHDYRMYLVCIGCLNEVYAGDRCPVWRS